MPWNDLRHVPYFVIQVHSGPKGDPSKTPALKVHARVMLALVTVIMRAHWTYRWSHLALGGTTPAPCRRCATPLTSNVPYALLQSLL